MTTRRVRFAALVFALALGLTACGGSEQKGARDIQAARASSSVFTIFPPRASSIACQIPHGGPPAVGKTQLGGTCTTELRTYHPPKGVHGGHGTVGIVDVAFTERWRYPASSKRWWQTTWTVPVRDGDAMSEDTQTTDAAPPQSWR